MQKLFIVFFLIITSEAFAQQGITNYNSFFIDNKEVVWAQVYHINDSIKKFSPKLFEHLKRKVWIKNLHYEDKEIIAELIDYRPDYKRYGGKFMNTSSVIRTGRWKGKVRISFKEGKYRVIIYGLQYDAQQPSTGSGKATLEQHDISGTLSDLTLNNYRSAFKKNRLKDLDILHFSLKDSFTLTFDQIIDSDW